MLSACSFSPRYSFEVDSICNTKLGMGESFIVTSGNPSINENDLRFGEVSSYFKLIMNNMGYFETYDVIRADMIIELDYYLGEPRESFSVRSVPMTHTIPGRTYSIEVPVYDDAGKLLRYTHEVITEPDSTHTYYEERVDTQTLYEKGLRATAYESRPGSAANGPTQLWNINVSITNGSKDLRKYIPFMITAAAPYVGGNTGKCIDVVVSEEDVLAVLSPPESATSGIPAE